MGGERVWMNPYEIITAQEISKGRRLMRKQLTLWPRKVMYKFERPKRPIEDNDVVYGIVNCVFRRIPAQDQIISFIPDFEMEIISAILFGKPR